MDPEQTFIRVQERFSQMLTPRVRATLEYIYLFLAVTLFCILVVMHANYVQQPGCSSELSGALTTEAQLIQIKITSDGLWSWNESAGSRAWRGKLDLKLSKPDDERVEPQVESSVDAKTSEPTVEDAVIKIARGDPFIYFILSAKKAFRAAIARRLSSVWRHAAPLFRSSWINRTVLRRGGGLGPWVRPRRGPSWIFKTLLSKQKRGVAGVRLYRDFSKWFRLRILHLDKINSFAVQWLERRSKTSEPTYLYTMEKGYFLLPEEAKTQHNIRTTNISISARHSCFGNRWQQLLINRVVGYDTILVNSLLNSPGQGYLYNYQTKEFYNLSYVHELPEGPARFGDYLVTKCGVLMMSLFVFFTTTMSVSFTLRETQTRMLKFTVQLQHHARHRLPTFQLIFVHVIESLVFVPIMIGILFFLFEFYDDQLLAFMVLILVWLCELFTLISVRTPISMKFFPRFFLLYFLVFHIYFFSYPYGFTYLALTTTAAFMQHLILYFWNRFEVPALQRFMQNRRSQHPDFHITSSTILASTLHITRLNTRNPGAINPDLNPGPPALRPGPGPDLDRTVPRPGPGLGPTNPLHMVGQPETAQNPGTMNSFSSLLLWILGGASSEGLNSFLSIFRDMRDHGQVYADSPRHQENHQTQTVQ